MEQKIRAYIEQLFSAAPRTIEAHDAREELVSNSIERYRDLLTRDFDEQEAYDMVIDSIGDLRELIEELSASEAEPQGEAPPHSEQEEGPTYRSDAGWRHETREDPWRALAESLSQMSREIGSAVSEVTSEVFRAEHWDFGGSSMKLMRRQSVPLEGCRAIDIRFMSDQITLYHSKDETVVIEEYLNYDNPDYLCHVQTDEAGTLSIRNGHRRAQILLRSKLKIFIPRDFRGEISVATQSGSITSEDAFRLFSFTAKSVSGSVKIEHITSDDIIVHTTSGSVRAEDCDGNFELHSVSGSIKAEDLVGCGAFRTTSGAIRLEFDDIRGAVTATSISGGIRLEVPSHQGLDFQLSSLSGGIHSDFDSHLQYQRRQSASGTIGNPPYFPVTVRTTSGGIHIND